MKYQRFTPSDYKDIGISTFEFVANTRFLSGSFEVAGHVQTIECKTDSTVNESSYSTYQVDRMRGCRVPGV